MPEEQALAALEQLAEDSYDADAPTEAEPVEEEPTLFKLIRDPIFDELMTSFEISIAQGGPPFNISVISTKAAYRVYKLLAKLGMEVRDAEEQEAQASASET